MDTSFKRRKPIVDHIWTNSCMNIKNINMMPVWRGNISSILLFIIGSSQVTNIRKVIYFHCMDSSVLFLNEIENKSIFFIMNKSVQIYQHCKTLHTLNLFKQNEFYTWKRKLHLYMFCYNLWWCNTPARNQWRVDKSFESSI